MNRTRGPLQLFWLDSSGKRVAYGNLQVGTPFQQGTYANHPWLTVDAKGACVALFQPQDTSTVTVTDVLGPTVGQYLSALSK